MTAIALTFNATTSRLEQKNKEIYDTSYKARVRAGKSELLVR